jgi:hypothetical protein
MMILGFAGPDFIAYRRNTRAASGLISSPLLPLRRGRVGASFSIEAGVPAGARPHRRCAPLRSFSILADVNEITYANSLVIYVGYTANFAKPVEINTMGIFQPNIFRSVQSGVRSHDVTILFGYAAFLIVLLIAIYFDSITSGIASGDPTSMTVFP